MGGSISSAAKWTVNAVLQKTVVGLLKQYVKSDVAIDLFHENGLSLKNVDLDEGAINTKLAAALDVKNVLPVVVKEGGIGELSVSLSEMAVKLKGLTLEAAMVDPSVASSLTPPASSVEQEDNDVDDDVDDDDEFVEPEEAMSCASLIDPQLCENWKNFDATEDDTNAVAAPAPSTDGDVDSSLGTELAGALFRIHVSIEDIRIAITDSVSRSKIIVVIDRLETVHDEQKASRNLILGNITVSLVDPTDDKTYPLMMLINGSDGSSDRSGTAVASVKFGESLEFSAEMGSSSLTLSLNMKHVPFLMTLLESCMSCFSGMGNDSSNKKAKKESATDSNSAPSVDNHADKNVAEVHPAEILPTQTTKKRIAFHFVFGKLVVAIRAEDISPSKTLRVLVRKVELDYAELDEGIRVSASLEDFALGAEITERRPGSSPSVTNFLWNDGKRMAVSVNPSDCRTSVKVLLPPIRVVVDKYLVDMIQRIIAAFSKESSSAKPDVSPASNPVQHCPSDDKAKKNGLTHIEVSTVDLSVVVNRGLDDCSWSPFHYFGSESPFEMRVLCKGLNVTMVNSMNTQHISCQFDEARVYTTRRGMPKVLLRVSQANGRTPTVDLLLQPVNDPIPFVAVINPDAQTVTNEHSQMLSTQSGLASTMSSRQRFLDKFSLRGMNSLFSDPFLSYSTVPGLRGKEMLNFDWLTNYNRSEMQVSVVLPKLDVDVSHDELCFFSALGNLFSSSEEGTMSLLLNTDLRIILRDEREDPSKFVEIASSDLAAVLISGFSRGGCPFKNASRGMIVSLLADSFVCKGFGFLSYPIVFLRMRESKDRAFYTSNLPPIFVLTGDMKISYKHKKFMVKSLLWTPSSPVLSFMSRASTTVFDGDEPPPVVPEPPWPTVPSFEFTLNPVVAYLRTSQSGREVCIAVSIHRILVKAQIPDEGPMNVQVAIGTIQGFHRRGVGTINIVQHSREILANNFSKCIQEGDGFTPFLVCCVKQSVKPVATATGFVSFLSCHCEIGDRTEVSLDFKRADVKVILVPETVYGLSAVMGRVSDITDVISGPTTPPSVNLALAVDPRYADTWVPNDEVAESRSNKAVFVLDQTAEYDRAGGEVATVANNLPTEIERVVENVAFKPPPPKEGDEESDGEWDAKEVATEPSKPVTAITVTNFEMSATVHFDQHAVYKPQEYVMLVVSLEKLRYDTMAPTVPNEGAPSPFFLSVRMGDIAITCDIENSSWKNIFLRDIERMQRWSLKEKENSSSGDGEENVVEDLQESRIDMLTPSFFTSKGSFFRLQIQSRNYGEQALALTVKARMQPFKCYLTQRTLSFLFEFKRIAFPPSTDKPLQELKPTLNVWTESIFDEVRIMPLKLRFSYRPQVGAPIPVWETDSDYKWIFMIVPSLTESETHFSDFHFVAPKDRPVPLSILKDRIIASYYPSGRNIVDIAGSLGPVQLLVKFFKNTVKIVHARKSDVPDESLNALNSLSRGLNTVAVETINLGSQSFFAIVRLLHWADSAISCGDATAQSITTLADTPQTMAEGFRSAGASIAQGFSTAVDGVVRLPISAYHNRGFLSSIATFTRNIPGVVLRPVVGVGDALLKVLFSLRNTMDPTIRLRELSPFVAPETEVSNNDTSTQSLQCDDALQSTKEVK